jgi:hypothetical protein
MNGARVRGRVKVRAFIIYITLRLLLTLYPSIRFEPFAIYDLVEAHCWTAAVDEH